MQCKKRKKKCDETQPACRNCLRSCLVCTWRDTPDYTRLPRETVLQMRTPQSDTPNATFFKMAAGVQPLPFSTPPDASADEAANFRLCLDVFQSAQQYPALDTLFSRAFDTHVIIKALLDGWDSVQTVFQLDAQWSYFEKVDLAMAACGHSAGARFASLWLFRLVTKVGSSVPTEKHLKLIHTF